MIIHGVLYTVLYYFDFLLAPLLLLCDRVIIYLQKLACYLSTECELGVL